jgi:hypothetical protein
MPKLTPLVLAACAITASGITTAGAQSKDRLAIGITDHEGFFIDGKSFSIVPGRTQKELSDLIDKLDAHSLGPGAIIFRMGDKLYIAEAPVAVERYGGSRNDYGGDRYGRDSGGTVADAERDFREWQNSLRRGSDRYGGSRNDYGSDRYGRDSGGTEADAERDFREWQNSLRRGSDRYGGSRNDYGSDRYGRDSGGTEADAERDFREWQNSLRRGSDRYGGSRNDYGSDRYGRDSGGTVADAERDFREWQNSLRRGSDRYGGSRNDYGSDRVYISDPDYVQFKLRQAFEENWGAPIENK